MRLLDNFKIVRQAAKLHWQLFVKDVHSRINFVGSVAREIKKRPELQRPVKVWNASGINDIRNMAQATFDADKQKAVLKELGIER